MNQDHLALFHAVAEAGGITAGAKRLHLSQPAASKRLSDLERDVGQALFDRLPRRGVRLTAAGQVLFSYSGRLAALQAQAERSMRSLANLESGKLLIGASSTIGTYLLPPSIAAFRTGRPGVEVDLRIGNSDAIVTMLRDARINLAFSEDDRTPPGGDITSEQFCVDELIVFCRSDHPLLRRGPMLPAELVRYPFILREPGSGTRVVFEGALSKHGLAVVPDLVLGSNEAIKQAVTGCRHLAAMSRMALAGELASGGLCELPTTGLSMRRDLLLLRQAWRADGPAVRAFLAVVQGVQRR